MEQSRLGLASRKRVFGALAKVVAGRFSFATTIVAVPNFGRQASVCAWSRRAPDAEKIASSVPGSERLNTPQNDLGSGLVGSRIEI